MGYKITPDVKKWGFIYSTSQINAVNTVESAQKYLDKKGVKYESATVETSADVKSSTETLIKKGCDVIFVPNDAIVQDGVIALAQVCNEAKIPTYCSSATTVNSGCLATLAIDDKGIGAKTADKCIEYMKGPQRAEYRGPCRPRRYRRCSAWRRAVPYRAGWDGGGWWKAISALPGSRSTRSHRGHWRPATAPAQYPRCRHRIRQF